MGKTKASKDSPVLLEVGTGYDMTKYAESHKCTDDAIYLAQSVLIHKGLQGILNCRIPEYDSAAILEFWDNLKVMDDEETLQTVVKEVEINIDAEFMEKVFGFEPFGPNPVSKPEYTDADLKDFFKSFCLDDKLEVRYGLKNNLFKKEYTDIGAFFSRALWGYTGGNDEMSRAKVEMLFALTNNLNIDWGAYLIGLFRSFMESSKLPLVCQIQRILNFVGVKIENGEKINQTKFKKPSNLKIDDLSDEKIASLRQKVVDAHYGVKDGADIGHVAEKRPNEDELPADDDCLIEILQSLKEKKKGKQTVFGGLVDEPVEEDEHVAAAVLTGSLEHLDADVFRSVDEDVGTTEPTEADVNRQLEGDLFGFAEYVEDQNKEKSIADDDPLNLMPMIIKETKKRKGGQKGGKTSKRRKNLTEAVSESSPRPYTVSPRSISETPLSISETEKLSETLPETNDLTDLNTVPIDSLEFGVTRGVVDRLVVKNFRRRIKELLSYKLSHRRVVVDQSLLDFEDWVSDQISPLSFASILFVPENKPRIKSLIDSMKSTVTEEDSRFKPSEVVGELDASDDEWEKVDDVDTSNQEEQGGKLDVIMKMLEEVKSSVEKVEKSSGGMDLVKVAEKIELETYNHLETFQSNLQQFTVDMSDIVQELGNNYQVAGLVLDKFVADANKGEMANTPAAREALRIQLLKKEKTKEALLREPGLGRMILTDDILKTFRSFQEKPRVWQKYSEFDFWTGVEVYLKELFVEFKIKEYRMAKQAKVLITWMDVADEFQEMYYAGVFNMYGDWRFHMEEAWRLFLYCTPNGMNYFKQHWTWMETYAKEYKQYESMTREEKEAFAQERMKETQEQRRLRIEKQVREALMEKIRKETEDAGTS